WDVRTDEWDSAYERLTKFARTNGHARVPAKHVEDGFKLGQWVRVQRTRFQSWTLTRDQRDRLEDVPGWEWSLRPTTTKMPWDARFELVRRYAVRHGTCNAPPGYREDGFELNAWIKTQRARRKTLNEGQVAALKSLPGWTWDPRDDTWEEHYSALLRFVAREGHARVPAAHIEGGVKLGTWVVGQRTRFAGGQLSPDQIERLGAQPGWAWRLRIGRS